MTVPKRRITTPERQLGTVATIATQLAHQWDTYLATIAALTPPLLRAAGTNPSSGGHADPTAHHALAHTHHDDVLEAIAAWVEQGRWIATRVLGTLAADGPDAAHYDTTRRAHLCADPTCGEYAVARGLCKTHYDADRYQTRRQAQKPAPTAPPTHTCTDHTTDTHQAAHGPHSASLVESTIRVLDTGKLPDVTSTVESVATCGPCGWRGPSHLLATHHTTCPGPARADHG